MAEVVVIEHILKQQYSADVMEMRTRIDKVDYNEHYSPADDAFILYRYVTRQNNIIAFVSTPRNIPQFSATLQLTATTNIKLYKERQQHCGYQLQLKQAYTTIKTTPTRQLTNVHNRAEIALIHKANNYNCNGLHQITTNLQQLIPKS